MRESARIYDVRMAQFVLKREKLSHIIGARGSQDLRSPSLIMAPGITWIRFANLANRAVPIARSRPTTVHRVLRHYLGKGRIVSKIVPVVLNPPRGLW